MVFKVITICLLHFKCCMFYSEHISKASDIKVCFVQFYNLKVQTHLILNISSAMDHLKNAVFHCQYTRAHLFNVESN